MSTSPRRQRTGFTLIELLVVIAIMAILLAMVLPALQNLRESARRSLCQNQLRQVGLALHAYVDAHEFLPAGVTNPTGPIYQNQQGFHHSWIASLLPQLDESPLFQNLDASLSIYDGKNLAARKVVIPLLLCPSDTASEKSLPELGAVGLTNYVGNHHPQSSSIRRDNSGVLFLNRQLPLYEIPDGLSSTIIAGEAQRSPADFGWGSGTRATLRNGGTPINRTREASRYYNDPTAIPVEEVQIHGRFDSPTYGGAYGWQTQSGGSQDQYGGGYGDMGSGGMGGYGDDEGEFSEGVVITRPPAPRPPLRLSFEAGGFGSRHWGGAFFLNCDGAVRFVGEQIDGAVYARALNRRDGQPSVDW